MMRGLCVCLAVLLAARVDAGSVYDLLAEDPDLSEFLALLTSDKLLASIVTTEERTVFAPTNEAMARYQALGRQNRDSDLLKYHMVNLALTVDQLKAEGIVTTQLKGSQPVFVTVPRPGGSVFVNNARISSGDLRATSEREDDQVLHVIDEVLEPTVPRGARSSSQYNPSALELMANADQYQLGDDLAIEKFYQRVQQMEKNGVFDSTGNHTFFIPIDKSFDNLRDRISGEVLDGHVIPNQVLFTRAMGNSTFRTRAFGDQLQITARLRSEPGSSGDGTDLSEVQSTTLLGDVVHPAGSVLSRVVRPNIAVKNGVVHLIQQPLVVMDNTVLLFIQQGSGDRFEQFYSLLQNKAPDFMEMLMTEPYFTLFVPSNEAFRSVDPKRWKEIEDSPAKLMSLLKLHMVAQKVTTKITTETIRKSSNAQKLYSVDSEAGRKLYLSVADADSLTPRLTVEGNGTNASVIVADIGASNGIVHVIDRVLGVPYQTVGERIAADPAASGTSALISRLPGQVWADLRSADAPVTMFVPSNTAWERLKVDLPEAHKALFSRGAAPAQVAAVLERHLLAGVAHSIDELVRMQGGVESADKSMLKVQNIPGSADYEVKWKKLEVRVARPDEECTNGYIHLIDTVLLDKGEVTSAAAAPVAGSAALLLTLWTLAQRV